MDKPLISIIIPVYNIEPYIARCLDSVLRQTYPRMEIILVDDGSRDGSGEIIDQYGAKYENIHAFHKENGGVTSARLFGVSKAAGEYIGFVDGDDIIEPDMYERLMKNMLENGADISHCGYQMVFPSRVDYYYNTGLFAKQNNAAALKELLRGERIEPGLWNKLFHKSLFHSLLHGGVMDTSVKNMEDLLMNFWLFREAETSVYEDFCPYHYMVHEGSAATARLNENKLRDPRKVFHIILDNCGDDEELRRIVKSRLSGTLIGLAALPLGEQRELVQPYRTAARKELRALCPEILRGKYGKRTKFLTAWAACLPDTYRAAHSLYSKIKGTDKKYKVE